MTGDSMYRKQETAGMPSVRTGELTAPRPGWLDTSGLGFFQRLRVQRVEAEALERIAKKALVHRAERAAEVDEAKIDATAEVMLTKIGIDHDDTMRNLRITAFAGATASQAVLAATSVQSARKLVEVVAAEKKAITEMTKEDEDAREYLESVLRDVTQEGAEFQGYLRKKFTSALRQSVERQFLGE